MPIHISINLFATLASFQPQNAERYALEAGTTVQAVLLELGVPLKDVQIVFINGVKAELDATPQDGDRVGIFPAVGGG